MAAIKTQAISPLTFFLLIGEAHLTIPIGSPSGCSDHGDGFGKMPMGPNQVFDVNRQLEN